MSNALFNLLKSVISGGKLIVQYTTGPDLLDSNNNETIKSVATTSAVNEISVTNAAANGAPIIGTSGSDSNIGLRLQAKGTAAIVAEDALLYLRSVATISTADAATYTAAQIVGGLIDRDPNGADRSDVTPTAAQLVAAVPGVQVGSSFVLYVKNTADAAETITVTAGSNVTLTGTMTIAQNKTRAFLVLFTNVTSSSEAVTIRSLGDATH